MNLPDILQILGSYTRSGQGRYMASCPMPGHRDSDPSVAITQDVKTGKILMHCWGCNTKAPDLVQAMGLPMSALQGDPGHPAAVQQTGNAVEVSAEDQAALEHRVKEAMDNLHLAEDYIYSRFDITTEQGRSIGLGVDDAFGVPHLIVPFLDPNGKVVGMQGRRLVDGEPRWRSVSGGGWSKVGCINWGKEEKGPVIITEGPSDGLAVAGRANLPAIVIRGASNIAPEVCEQIRDWLGDKTAVVVGDSDDAGRKFAEAIGEGVGVPAWELPEGNDLCDYLGAGGSLEDAIFLATGKRAEIVETAQEKTARLQAAIEVDIQLAIYNEELKQELGDLPTWQLDDILAGVMANAAYGQRQNTRIRVNALQRAIRDMDVPGGHGVGGAGGGGGLHAPIPDGFDPEGLPVIIWNPEDQLHITEHSIREAMDNYGDDRYYRSATGSYIKIVGDEITPLKEAGVKSMLSQMGTWRIVSGQRETAHVPNDAARLICDPAWECDLPEIKRRVEVPFMLGDGDIVSSKGYHEASGVYLLPRHGDQIVVPSVPDTVTDQNVADAVRILEDVIEGFRFKDNASRTNLVAMTLTSPLRELFRANPMVPLLTSTAPQSGSGKGTSIRVPLSTAGVGPHSLATTAYNSDENEFEKKLVGKLLKKSTYIFLDNIRAMVNSSVLEQMLTAANYDGRTLGYSEVNSLSTLVLWVCTLQSTGSFNRDLTRRCVPVELIKNYKGSWEHKNIEAYLADKRGELIWACFVLARKWMQEGSPISNARLDGYGGWTEVIGGIIEHVLGYEDFLGNLEEFRHHQDESGMTIDGIMERWLVSYGEDAKPARMAVEDFEDPELHRMLGLHNPTPRQTMSAMTRVLDSQRGYIIGNTHMWKPLGPCQYGNEGITRLYRCARLED